MTEASEPFWLNQRIHERGAKTWTASAYWDGTVRDLVRSSTTIVLCSFPPIQASKNACLFLCSRGSWSLRKTHWTNNLSDFYCNGCWANGGAQHVQLTYAHWNRIAV